MENRKIEMFEHVWTRKCEDPFKVLGYLGYEINIYQKHQMGML